MLPNECANGKRNSYLRAEFEAGLDQDSRRQAGGQGGRDAASLVIVSSR